MRGTVLVVDDDQTVRRCLGEFLEAEGYKVLSAPNGRAALAILEEEVPDLLLVEVDMPVMSGSRLAEALAHYPDLARIPLILMSRRKEHEAVPPPPHRVVQKPLNLDWLASTVATLAAA